jgi:hypothetical protein
MGEPGRSKTLPSRWKQLTGEEVRQFIEHGYIVVRDVFLRDLADRIILLLRAELDIDIDDSSTWTGPMFTLRKVFEKQPFIQIHTQRYLGALDDLCGQGRWEATMGVGDWPILLPGANPPWSPPERGWHVDISLDHPRLNSPSLGLIGVELFTDIEAGGGGTALRVGSHCYMTRILAEARSDELTESDLTLRAVNNTDHLPVVEVTGQAGDVLLMHPLTVHAVSQNTGRGARIAAVKIINLYEPMNLKRENPSDYSPVEQAIVNALAAI